VVVGRHLLVRDGVDAHAQELLPDVRVPVVLDLVVRPALQLRRDRRPPNPTKFTYPRQSLQRLTTKLTVHVSMVAN
jgi:hypothetical protein